MGPVTPQRICMSGVSSSSFDRCPWPCALLLLGLACGRTNETKSGSDADSGTTSSNVGGGANAQTSANATGTANEGSGGTLQASTGGGSTSSSVGETGSSGTSTAAGATGAAGAGTWMCDGIDLLTHPEYSDCCAGKPCRGLCDNEEVCACPDQATMDPHEGGCPEGYFCCAVYNTVCLPVGTQCSGGPP